MIQYMVPGEYCFLEFEDVELHRFSQVSACSLWPVMMMPLNNVTNNESNNDLYLNYLTVLIQIGRKGRLINKNRQKVYTYDGVGVWMLDSCSYFKQSRKWKYQVKCQKSIKSESCRLTWYFHFNAVMILKVKRTKVTVFFTERSKWG